MGMELGSMYIMTIADACVTSIGMVGCDHKCFGSMRPRSAMERGVATPIRSGGCGAYYSYYNHYRGWMGLFKRVGLSSVAEQILLAPGCLLFLGREETNQKGKVARHQLSISGSLPCLPLLSLFKMRFLFFAPPLLSVLSTTVSAVCSGGGSYYVCCESYSAGAQGTKTGENCACVLSFGLFS